MTHDNDLRREKPSIAAYRGNGVNISMMCGRCHQPRPQLGSRRIKRCGVITAICKQCAQELGK